MTRYLTALLLVALTGCTAQAAPEPKPDAAPQVYDESELRAFLGVKHDVYTAPDGTRCEAYVFMTTPAMVATYRDAGDVVATNPDASAGVKITDAQGATCYRLLTAALEGFPE